MCKKKRFYLFRLLSSFLAVWLFVLLSIGSFAEEVQEPSSEIDQKNWQYWNSGYSLVKDNTQGFLTRRFGFITDSSAGAEIYAHAMETLNDSWDALTSEEKARYDNDFRYYVGYQILGDRQGESVTPVEIDVQPEAEEAFQTAINVYVQNNPLGYHVAYIHSINFLNVIQWSNYVQYKNIIDWGKQNNGYLFMRADKTQSYSTISPICYITCVPRADVDFVGSAPSGIMSNVRCYANWSEVNWGYKQFKVFQQNGSSSEQYGMGQNFVNVYNITGSQNNNLTVFTSNEKDEAVYVFDNVNAYKMYNSARPQAYYQAPSEMIDSQNTISSITGSNNSYQYITNNIKSGMTGQEVIDLVALVMSRTSGNGSGGGSDDDDSSLWEKIGNAIGNLIDGIVDVIASVIEKLTDAILSVIHLLTGYTDDGGVYHEGLLGKLTSLISVDFNNFLGSVFDWLPPGIVTLFTATLVFAVFFAIWKMIRG